MKDVTNIISASASRHVTASGECVEMHIIIIIIITYTTLGLHECINSRLRWRQFWLITETMSDSNGRQGLRGTALVANIVGLLDVLYNASWQVVIANLVIYQRVDQSDTHTHTHTGLDVHMYVRSDASRSEICQQLVGHWLYRRVLMVPANSTRFGFFDYSDSERRSVVVVYTCPLQVTSDALSQNLSAAKPNIGRY